MKFSMFIFSTLASLAVFALPDAIGKAALSRLRSHAGPAFELNIDGQPAQLLFETLDVPVQVIKGANSDWRNKRGADITCGQNMGNNQYSCSIIVDERGIQR